MAIDLRKNIGVTTNVTVPPAPLPPSPAVPIDYNVSVDINYNPNDVVYSQGIDNTVSVPVTPTVQNQTTNTSNVDLSQYIDIASYQQAMILIASLENSIKVERRENAILNNQLSVTNNQIAVIKADLQLYKDRLDDAAKEFKRREKNYDDIINRKCRDLASLELRFQVAQDMNEELKNKLIGLNNQYQELKKKTEEDANKVSFTKWLFG